MAGVDVLMQKMFNEVLQAEMTEHLGADRYERSEDRTGYRHGSYERELTTRVGRLTLEVPRAQDGSFSTELFDRYQRSEHVPTTVGEGPRSGADGDGRPRSLHTPSQEDHHEALRTPIYEVYRFTVDRGLGGAG
jgi:hypothetical protein